MYLYSSICLLIIFNYSPSFGGRIVGGQFGDISNFPYQVYLDAAGHLCGGSIISSQWTLTAAHCVHRLHESQVIVYAGSSILNDGLAHEVSNIYTHKLYKTNTMDFDAALLEMEDLFDFSNPKIKPVALVDRNRGPRPGVSAVVSGWGYTRERGSTSNTLQWVKVSVIQMNICRKNYRRAGDKITARMICAGNMSGGQDSCQGDSGGPLVSGNSQIGIVSWGIGCARNGLPGVYTNLAHANIRNWIKKTAGV